MQQFRRRCFTFDCRSAELVLTNERTVSLVQLLDEVRQAKRLPTPAAARMIRIAAGVSQERLAVELGVHRMTVVRWESGERAPRGLHRAVYAQLLDQLRAEVAP
jgi:DNA-binding transcriptional regulator YiaG